MLNSGKLAMEPHHPPRATSRARLFGVLGGNSRERLTGEAGTIGAWFASLFLLSSWLRSVAAHPLIQALRCVASSLTQEPLRRWKLQPSMTLIQCPLSTWAAAFASRR